MTTSEPTFCGIPVSNFCAYCGPLVQKCISEGKLGIAGLCQTCSKMCDDANPIKYPHTHKEFAEDCIRCQLETVTEALEHIHRILDE